MAIQAQKLIRDFQTLSHNDKEKKVINLLQAIYDRTQQFGDILTLIKQVKNVPIKLLVDTYTSIIIYGDDMNNVKIKEKMGKTAYILKLIWKEEAKEKLQDEEDLAKMEEIMMNTER